MIGDRVAARVSVAGVPLGPVTDGKRWKQRPINNSLHDRPKARWPHDLNRRQADVLRLLELGARDLHQVADALSILPSEADRTLMQLIRRDFIEEIHGYPVTWRAA